MDGVRTKGEGYDLYTMVADKRSLWLSWVSFTLHRQRHATAILHRS